jgi:hypothetical protein
MKLILLYFLLKITISLSSADDPSLLTLKDLYRTSYPNDPIIYGSQYLNSTKYIDDQEEVIHL